MENAVTGKFYETVVWSATMYIDRSVGQLKKLKIKVAEMAMQKRTCGVTRPDRIYKKKRLAVANIAGKMRDTASTNKRLKCTSRSEFIN